MKERNANMSFKKSKRSAYRSRRSPQLTPRFSQATLVEGRDEDLHSVDSVHFPTACNLISKTTVRLMVRLSVLRCRRPLVVSPPKAPFRVAPELPGRSFRPGFSSPLHILPFERA